MAVFLCFLIFNIKLTDVISFEQLGSVDWTETKKVGWYVKRTNSGITLFVLVFSFQYSRTSMAWTQMEC